MNEDNFEELRMKDLNLREAIRMEEMERPQMPTDLNARLMKRVEKEVNQRNQRKRILWPLLAAACVAGIVAIFLTPPRTTGDDTQGKQIAKVETKPTSTPASEVKPETVQETKTEVPAEQKAEQPKTKKRMTPSTQTTSETLMAKADAPQEQQAETKAEETILLASHSDEKAETKMVTLSERDIPVTRPENLAYTKEEIEQMKRQSNEAYLKWVELELEISKYNLEQTAQK